MKLDDLKKDAVAMSRWEKHRFFVLIFGVISISTVLVAVALGLYNSNGTAQLDLSLPSYKDVRKQATRVDITDNFSASGELDKESLDTFRDMYSARAKKVVSGNSFDSSALSDDSLQLFDTTETQPSI